LDLDVVFNAKKSSLFVVGIKLMMWQLTVYIQDVIVYLGS